MTILEKIFGVKVIPFLKDLLSKKEYIDIRRNANYLLSLNEKEFAQDFEYALTKSHLLPIEGEDPFSGKELNDVTEIFFLYYLCYYSAKGMAIIDEYLHHCGQIEKQVSQMTIEAYNKFSFIFDFVNLRINKIASLDEPPTTLKDLQIPVEHVIGKKDIPLKIALLNEIGFFELPLLKNLTSTKKREVIIKLIGGTDRQIKGNINVLNPHSMDDRTRYTSFTYDEEVKSFVSKLFNT